jgi:superfamily II DNA helicase RecQ
MSIEKFIIRTPRYAVDKDPQEVLKKVFKLDGFRGLQLDIIKAALDNKDVVVLMVSTL